MAPRTIPAQGARDDLGRETTPGQEARLLRALGQVRGRRRELARQQVYGPLEFALFQRLRRFGIERNLMLLQLLADPQIAVARRTCAHA